jgi:hypothetical protein
MRPGTLLIFVTFLVATEAPAAAAPALLVLPVDGPHLSVTVRDEIEDALHQALAARAPPALRGRAATRTVISDAAGAGLVCPHVDVACAAQLGAISMADQVLIAELVGGAGLKLTLVDVAAARAVIVTAGHVVLPSKDGGASVAAVAARAFEPPAILSLDARPPGSLVTLDDVVLGRSPLPAPVGVEVGERQLHLDRSGVVETRSINLRRGGKTTLVLEPLRDVASAAAGVGPGEGERSTAQPAAEVSSLLVAGTVVAAVGTAAALGFGIGAGIVELQLSTPKPGRDDVEDLKTVGVGLVAASVVGAAVAALGGTFVGIGLGEGAGGR